MAGEAHLTEAEWNEAIDEWFANQKKEILSLRLLFCVLMIEKAS